MTHNCVNGNLPVRMPWTPPPDCLACGVCCFSELDTYVRVTGDDWARLGLGAERLAHFIGNRAYLRMERGHCAALRVEENDSGARRYFCTIYDRRPSVCRGLDRGSPECAGELSLKGDRAAEARVSELTATPK